VKRLDFLTLPCLVVEDDIDIEAPFPVPCLSENNLMNYYLLDAASLFPVQALNIQPGDNVLDMCAAPGGKSLAIALQLFISHENGLIKFTSEGSLTCNDPSPSRRKRLQTVMHTYIPPQFHGEKITITSRDATLSTSFSEATFTKVLVDAPCSSERHVLHNEGEMVEWGMSRSRTNANRQITLLTTALGLVCSGGTVVYVTCSISTLENDEVVEKVMKKEKSEGVNVLRPQDYMTKWPSNSCIGEATKYGWQILPDSAERWGPLYCCVFTKD